MPLINSPSFEQASIYSDLNSLDQIRRQGLVDEHGAIKKAAQEFEAFFMNMMLKSMREASEVIGSDSPFSSQQEKMYVGMLDEQMSVNLSQDGHLRIADMMVEQLSRLSSKAINRDELSVHLKKIKPQDPIVTGEPDINKKVTLQPVRKTIHLDKLTGIAAHKTQKIISQDSDKPSVEETAIKPAKRPVFEQISDFINELMPLAKKAAEKLRLDPRLLIAQAALETGWGKFVMHDDKGLPGFNLFGIKAGGNWQGDHIKMDTLEVDEQQVKKVSANFRKYQNFAESFQDYVDFVTSNPRYQAAIKAAPQAKDYLKELQESGYATDPNYAEKIMRIFEDQKLQHFEPSSEGNGNTSR